MMPHFLLKNFEKSYHYIISNNINSKEQWEHPFAIIHMIHLLLPIHCPTFTEWALRTNMAHLDFCSQLPTTHSFSLLNPWQPVSSSSAFCCSFFSMFCLDDASVIPYIKYLSWWSSCYILPHISPVTKSHSTMFTWFICCLHI